jgi:hypothetical protein
MVSVLSLSFRKKLFSKSFDLAYFTWVNRHIVDTTLKIVSGLSKLRLLGAHSSHVIKKNIILYVEINFLL